MAKRPSLADSMKAVQPPAGPRSIEALGASDAPGGREVGRGYFAATREGMKRITFPSPPEDHRRLKRLAVDTDRTIEDLMREALADLFAKHGG